MIGRRLDNKELGLVTDFVKTLTSIDLICGKHNKDVVDA